MWDDMTTQELTPREVTRELRRLSALIDKANEKLYGNGNQGLAEMTRVNIDTLERLEKRFEKHLQDLESQEKEKKDDEKFTKRLFLGALFTNSLAILGGLLALLRYLLS